MPRPSFDVARLRAFVAEKVGEPVDRFTQLTACSNASNFAAVTAGGRRLLVKCTAAPRAGRIDYFAHFVRHLEELKGTRAIQLTHGPFDWEARRVIVIAWCAGRRVMPDRLTAAQEAGLVTAYGEFSAAIQRCTQILPPRDNAAVRDEAMRLMAGRACAGLRRFLDRELPPASLAYDPARLKVIHGDLHHGNFHFDGDRMTGFMDLEDFRYGYPADDWARYILCAAEHLHWYDRAGRRRLTALFRRLLPLAPADEWREAVGGLLVRKMWRRFKKKKGSAWWLAVNLRFRLGYYRDLFALIAEGAAGRPDLWGQTPTFGDRPRLKRR